MLLKDWYSSVEKQTIERRMMEAVSNNTNSQIKKIIKKQIFPSKRIRSYFLFLLNNGLLNKKDFIIIATAIELFHQATLIFDDVIDNTDIRDGNRITLHNKYGHGVASAGKADHIATVLMLLSEQELRKTRTINIFDDFISLRLEMFKSQLADTFVIKKPDNVSYLHWLLHVSYKKTSSFMELPFLIYGQKINATEKKIESLKNVGKGVGILYQIGDDLFDLEEGIKTGSLALTYPFAYLLDNKEVLSAPESTFFKKIFKIKTLDKKKAKKLTFVFKHHERKIIASAQEYFEKYFGEIQKSDFPAKDLIIGLLQKIIDPKYWRYEA